jgi:hypothetical protein
MQHLFVEITFDHGMAAQRYESWGRRGEGVSQMLRRHVP